MLNNASTNEERSKAGTHNRAQAGELIREGSTRLGIEATTAQRYSVRVHPEWSGLLSRPGRRGISRMQVLLSHIGLLGFESCPGSRVLNGQGLQQ